MSKVVAIAASLKAVMVVAAGAVMRGDMLPVILISAMFEFGLQMRHNAYHREASYIGRKAIEISEREPPGQARKSGHLSPDR
jgi:hypothetical protein